LFFATNDSPLVPFAPSYVKTFYAFSVRESQGAWGVENKK